MIIITKKHIKSKNKKDKSFYKKLKHEPSLKKLGNFTVPEGHGYPLIYIYIYIYTLENMIVPSLITTCSIELKVQSENIGIMQGKRPSVITNFLIVIILLPDFIFKLSIK
jgi:hypothetical protein